MDSGLPQTHPDLSNIAERTDWTEDGTEDEGGVLSRHCKVDCKVR